MEQEPIKDAKYSAKQIADYFIYLGSQKLIDEGTPEGITPLKLQKMLYFAQAASLSLRNERVFSEDIEAWQYGPVIPSIYHQYKQSQNLPLTAPTGVYESIDDDTKELIDGVWDLLGKYSARQLVGFSHLHRPWKESYKEKQNIVINPEIIRDYYKDVFTITEE